MAAYCEPESPCEGQPYILLASRSENQCPLPSSDQLHSVATEFVEEEMASTETRVFPAPPHFLLSLILCPLTQHALWELSNYLWTKKIVAKNMFQLMGLVSCHLSVLTP